MSKLLLLLAIGVVAFLLFKRMRRPPVRPPVARAEDMVRCARCGVNLPKSEALCDRGVCVCPPDQPCDRT